MSDWITVTEAAKRLGVSRNVVNKRVHAGLVTSRKVKHYGPRGFQFLVRVDAPKAPAKDGRVAVAAAQAVGGVWTYSAGPQANETATAVDSLRTIIAVMRERGANLGKAADLLAQAQAVLTGEK